MPNAKPTLYHSEHEAFADRLNPTARGFSPFMANIVGAIINYDYGVRDSRGGRYTSLTITSDGYVLAASTAHESGAFIGTYADLQRNLTEFTKDLDGADWERFNQLRRERVTDWRPNAK